MADLITPYLFELNMEQLREKQLISYVMPARAYEAIKSAQGKLAHQNIDLRGLEAVLAWVAPCVDMYEIRRIDISNPGRSLHLWIYAPETPLDEVKMEVLNALSIWLGITLSADHSEMILEILKDERSTKTAWHDLSIDLDLTQGAACPVPKDSRLYDLIAVLASRGLEGKVLDDSRDSSRILLPAGPGESLYGGKSLLGYRPHSVESRKTGDVRGYWTEAIKVSALSTPEQQRLRVAISVSIRNYLPIHPASFKRGGSRYLDVFLTPDAFFTKGSERVRALQVSLKQNEVNALLGQSETQGGASLSVLRRILSLTSVNEASLATGKGLLGAVIERKVSIYPRAGAYHGDQNLPGETGVGVPERKTYFKFLDEHLSSIGFTPVSLERKTPPRASHFAHISKTESPMDSLNRQILREVMALNNEKTLHIALFSTRIWALSETNAALDLLLGEASSIVENERIYSCGLKVVIHPIPAGPFVAKLDDPKEASAKFTAGLPNAKRMQVERDAIRKATLKRQSELDEHLNSYMDTKQGVWLALVEMDKKLRDEPERDPYVLVYQALARRDTLAQVVLFDPEEREKFRLTPSKDDPHPFKLRSALRDLLRALGVVYVDIESVPDDTSLQAWWIVNLNSKRFERQPGARKDGAVLPVAVELINGRLMALFPDRMGAKNWKPYARAMLALYSEDYENTSDMRDEQLKTYIGQFFGSLTTQAEKSLSFCDASNIRKYVPQLGNSAMRFGELNMGNVGAAAAATVMRDGGSGTVVRLLTDTDKSPTYLVADNKTGIATGIFAEANSKRTFWLCRGLPIPLQKSGAIRTANQQSRFAEDDVRANLKARRFPSLSEICVVVLGKDEDARNVAGLTRKAMELHTSTDDATILPFPLHEASLLGESIR
ncbi:RNaseH domain-containing protein [Herbaspirillum chlorophenolicum]|uniref:RNaseH domain-containing protein n=1 Tax=Herbaspirillum chlorophenolicum TaxID=211589 RepID=A0ABW8F552_9BURK